MLHEVVGCGASQRGLWKCGAGAPAENIKGLSSVAPPATLSLKRGNKEAFPDVLLRSPAASLLDRTENAEQVTVECPCLKTQPWGLGEDIRRWTPARGLSCVFRGRHSFIFMHSSPTVLRIPTPHALAEDARIKALFLFPLPGASL